MNVVEENFGYTLEGVFAYHLGLLEQWLQLWLVRLLCGCEVLVQAQLGPRQALAPSQRNLAILARCNLEKHYVDVHAYHQGKGLHNHMPLPHGGNNLGT
jgi:hypothetical protein